MSTGGSTKTQAYNAHLTSTLLPALQATRKAIAKIQKDIEEYEDLIEKLRALLNASDGNGRQETMLELGAGVYADAHVYDTSRITLDIGLDVHVDVSVMEGEQLARKRVEVLQRKKAALAKNEEGLLWQVKQFQGAIHDAQEGTTTLTA